MSLEKIDQYIKELEAIKNYDVCRQTLSYYKIVYIFSIKEQFYISTKEQRSINSKQKT